MIQKYEGFLSNLFKSKDKKVKSDFRYWKDDKSPEKLRNYYVKVRELSNDCFIELEDRGYTIETKFDLNGTLYTQITKLKIEMGRFNKEMSYNFIDIKDDILSFHDRLEDDKDGIGDIEYSFVYNNDKGGFSCDYPKYEDFEKGDYDNREVTILTISFK